jgi:hypothetical protein
MYVFRGIKVDTSAGRHNFYWVIARKAVGHIKLFGYMLQYFLVLILTTSRDTTKLAFLTLAVLKVGIMNVGCFETGIFGVWAS